MKYAYASLITNDEYLWGALGLYYSLKKVNSFYPFILLVSSDCSSKTIETLKQHDIVIKRVNANKFKNPVMWYQTTLQKFNVFKLTEYDKICFLDADVLLYKNIDYLFEKSDKYWFDNREKYSGGRNWLCGEIWFATPLGKLYDIIKANLNDDDYTDEMVLTRIFKDYEVPQDFYLLHEVKHCVTIGSPLKYWQKYNIQNYEELKQIVDEILDNIIDY